MRLKEVGHQRNLTLNPIMLMMKNWLTVKKGSLWPPQYTYSLDSCITLWCKNIIDKTHGHVWQIITSDTSNRPLKSPFSGLLIFRGKKKQNFAGFSGANSRKNRPISWEKKSKFAEQSADFRRFSLEKSQNSQENRPILRDFSGKESIFKGFSGANNFLRIS